MSDLQDLLNQQMPAGWRPEEGDKVIGKVTEVATGTGNYGDNYPIIIINDEEKNELVAVHCFHHTLKEAILKEKPQIGERIAIQYNGEIPQKGNPALSVKLYKLVVDGRQGKADYSGFNQTQAPVSQPPNPPEEDIPY